MLNRVIKFWMEVGFSVRRNGVGSKAVLSKPIRGVWLVQRGRAEVLVRRASVTAHWLMGLSAWP